MKKFTFLLLALGVTFSYAQDFSFQMYFEDAAGFRDTITIGYDTNATNGIDNNLGEINIIGTPLNPNLDVRITDEIKNRSVSNQTTGTFATKTQYVKNNCPNFDFSQVLEINIFTNNWPVTASWDNTLFTETCNSGSVLTSALPGGWWDVGSPANLFSLLSNSTGTATIEKNSPNPYSEGNYSYIENTDTIYAYWIGLGAYAPIHNISVDESIANYLINIFPNPFVDFINIAHNDMITRFTLTNVSGQIIINKYINSTNAEIDLSNLSSGVYFAKIDTENATKTVKIIKK